MSVYDYKVLNAVFQSIIEINHEELQGKMLFHPMQLENIQSQQRKQILQAYVRNQISMYPKKIS